MNLFKKKIYCILFYLNFIYSVEHMCPITMGTMYDYTVWRYPYNVALCATLSVLFSLLCFGTLKHLSLYHLWLGKYNHRMNLAVHLNCLFWFQSISVSLMLVPFTVFKVTSKHLTHCDPLAIIAFYKQSHEFCFKQAMFLHLIKLTEFSWFCHSGDSSRWIC